MKTEAVARKQAAADQPTAPRAKSKAVRILATAAIAGSAVFLLLFLYQPGPRLESAPHRALGQVAAEETLKLLGAGGRIILVDRDPKLFASPATRAHLRSLTETLRQAGQRVALTNLLKVDPLRQLGVPPGDFFELFRRTTEADVVLSFLGPPTLSAEQAARLNAKRARVVAFCPGLVPQQSNLPRLFQLQLVQTAILDQPAPAAAVEAESSLRNWFERHYRIVTATNFPELAGEAGGR